MKYNNIITGTAASVENSLKRGDVQTFEVNPLSIKRFNKKFLPFVETITFGVVRYRDKNLYIFTCSQS